MLLRPVRARGAALASTFVQGMTKHQPNERPNRVPHEQETNQYAKQLAEPTHPD
jgi:hypothetical protein